MSRIHVCLILSLLVGIANASESHLTTQAASLGLSYETVTLPADESLGLLGLHYHKQFGRGYGGLAAFGAVSGQRGGFFTGGFEAGLQTPLTGSWRLDVGMFAGGGGGGSAPQGGGLMLKPYAGLLYDRNGWRLGVHVARVRFPNGDIDSTHIALTFERPFDSIGLAGWVPAEHRWVGQVLAGRTVRSREVFSAARLWTYEPLPGTRDTGGANGEAKLSLAGINVETYLTDQVFTGLQAGGAIDGNADGYAEVLWALGWQLARPSGWAWRNTLAAGSAGGGQVATGNGLIARVTTGLLYRFGSDWQLSIDAGYTTAPNGDFSANVIGVQLGRINKVPVTVWQAGRPVLSADQPSWRPRWWRLRGNIVRYHALDKDWRKNRVSGEQQIDLIGSTIDVMEAGHAVYVTGTALAACDGGAGGYASGLLGAGWRQPLTASKRAEFSAEISLGAAGGGGIDVGGGLVMQALTAVEVRITDRYGVMLSAARLAAANGKLRSDAIGLSLTYRFSSLLSAD